MQLYAPGAEANGYESIIVGTGREALSMLTSHCPDVVILDLGRRNGRYGRADPAARMVADAGGGSPPARTDEREKVRALDAGADDYITKPFGHIRAAGASAHGDRPYAHDERQREHREGKTAFYRARAGSSTMTNTACISTGAMRG